MKSGCVKPHFIGDGYCDDELNKEECNYDDGDCCGVDLDNKFCKECQCLGNPGKMMSAPNYLEDFINNPYWCFWSWEFQVFVESYKCFLVLLK